MEAPRARSRGGAGRLREVRNTRAVRARRSGRRLERHEPEDACAAVNGFLRSRFPSGTWTSIAVLFNPRMGLHRDIQNMPGHSNHALALRDYTGGRVWIEDDDGDSTTWLADKKGGRELRGRWLRRWVAGGPWPKVALMRP